MKDIILDSNWDLSIKNGDFEIGQSDRQNVFLRAFSEKGQWISDVLAGVGISSLINSTTTQLQRFKALLAEDIKGDGYTLENMELNEKGELNISFK